MMKPILLCLLCVGTIFAQSEPKSLTWGDQYNGTYNNPVLNADYSDPDIIKAGDTFYMVCSDFHYMGMQVLESKDLVNWTLINQIYNRFDFAEGYNTMQKYSQGSWAPSIRQHNGLFYVYFCTPEEGVYMATAKDPAGQWSPLVEVKRTKGWEDPCPFWDEDGTAYLGHSVLGAGPIIVHKMSPDGTKLLDDGVEVYRGNVAEGTKFYKRGGWYYLIIPEGGVATGEQVALRSKSIYGPYEHKIVLEQGSTAINGPHQGGLVELESGEAWFMHFQDVGALGRICHLQPVKWTDGWPLMGIDYDGNGIGEPVANYKKPDVSKAYTPEFPATSDEFDSKNLGFQWQWNHNPIDKNRSLLQKKGHLSLTAAKADDNKNAPNTLTQKMVGNSGTVTTRMATKDLADGQKAGLCLVGQNIHEVGVIKKGDRLYFYASNKGEAVTGPEVNREYVYLKMDINLKGSTVLSYSTDGKAYILIGTNCEIANSNYWKGARPALFSYNEVQEGGTAHFDWFHYTFE
ncbi:glycoside hydrolase family 43 protein [Flavobacterium akiainvivens]|nr:glycoside hydrolase 43 family protein [Flavobacterium akiainvivens]